VEELLLDAWKALQRVMLKPRSGRTMSHDKTPDELVSPVLPKTVLTSCIQAVVPVPVPVPFPVVCAAAVNARSALERIPSAEVTPEVYVYFVASLGSRLE